MHSLLWTSSQVPRIFAHVRILKNGLSTPSSVGEVLHRNKTFWGEPAKVFPILVVIQSATY